MKAGPRGTWRSRGEPPPAAEPIPPDPRRAFMDRAAEVVLPQLRDGEVMLAVTVTVATPHGDGVGHVTFSPDRWWSL